MIDCTCARPHRRKRIVLTGGPGAGKTAILELVRKTVSRNVHMVPESAGILFGGGFPRGSSGPLRRSAQRAIFYVQRELETLSDTPDVAAAICDRGTVDTCAYWPGPEDFWKALGTTLDEQLANYDAVIHLRTPPDAEYNHSNPLRIESAAEAAVIDDRIAALWSRHPRRFEVPATLDFFVKARRALELVHRELPACCVRVARSSVSVSSNA